MDNTFIDVHEALDKAIEAEKDSVAMVNANFKMHPIKKELLEQICAKRGVSISRWLRVCADDIIEKYVGPKKFKELFGTKS